ncbi:MAG: oleate hydratase, partial [Marinobacter psychrophilus]
RLFLEGTYLENILPLGPNETPDDLKGTGMFEQQLTHLRGLLEGKHSLATAKGWLQGAINNFRKRH